MAGSIIGSVAGPVIGGLLGGANTPSAPNIQVWQPPNLNQNAAQWQTLLGQNTANNPYATYNPDFQSTFTQQYSNPYAPGAQTAANTAGAAYTGAGNQSITSGQQLNGAASSLLPYISSVMNTAMDPQSALYNRTAQQTQDQSRVAQAARGITSSPYGAGLEAQNMSNFNIDWQAQQLANQVSGLGAAGQALTSAGNNLSTANNITTAGAGAVAQGGLLPYTTSQGQATDQQTALTNIINASLGPNQLNQTAMGDIMSYLGLGANQSNAQAGATQTSYLDQLQQAGTQATGLSSILGGAANGANWLSSPSSSLPWMTNASNVGNQLSYFLS